MSFSPSSFCMGIGFGLDLEYGQRLKFSNFRLLLYDYMLLNQFSLNTLTMYK